MCDVTRGPGVPSVRGLDDQAAVVVDGHGPAEDVGSLRPAQDDLLPEGAAPAPVCVAQPGLVATGQARIPAPQRREVCGDEPVPVDVAGSRQAQ